MFPPLLWSRLRRTFQCQRLWWCHRMSSSQLPWWFPRSLSAFKLSMFPTPLLYHRGRSGQQQKSKRRLYPPQDGPAGTLSVQQTLKSPNVPTSRHEWYRLSPTLLATMPAITLAKSSRALERTGLIYVLLKAHGVMQCPMSMPVPVSTSMIPAVLLWPIHICSRL